MVDVIGIGMSKLLHISVGFLLVAITSLALAYWETHNHNNSSESPAAASLIPIKVMEGLKMEINDNIHKFHDEMGYAAWIVYFTYGAIGFLAAFVAVILLLMLIKAQIRNNIAKQFHDASCQTDSIACILQELKDLIGSENDNEAQSASASTGTACSTEDSGINFFDDCDGKLHHQENEGTCWGCPPHSPRITTTRLDISFVKTQNVQQPGDILTRSSFTIATPVLEIKAVAMLEYYSTRYFMPVVSAPQGQSQNEGPTSPTPILFNGHEIPNIEISVEEKETPCFVDDIQY